jgi:hypothetical protein
MSQAQCRAKSGASLAVNEEETIGVIGEVPVVVKTQTAAAGTGDKICCCKPAGTVVVTGGCGTEDGPAVQHGIVPA